MADRLDALCARESNGKTYYSRIGVAFANKNGGWSVMLDAMPASVDGQYKILLMPPREQRDAAPKDETRRDSFDEEPPFDRRY